MTQATSRSTPQILVGALVTLTAFLGLGCYRSAFDTLRDRRAAAWALALRV